MKKRPTSVRLIAKPWALPSILALSLLPLACTPTYLLRDDFKEDPVNSLPIKNIPGDPVGDAVEYIPQIESRLKIVSFPQTSSGKGLEFNSKPDNLTTQGQYSTTWLNFRGKSTSNFSKVIQYSLVAKFDNFKDEPLLEISNGAAGVFTRLEVKQDGSLYARESFAQTPPPVLVCRLQPNVIYFVIVNVNIAKRTTAIAISGQVIVDNETRSGVNKKITSLYDQLANVQGPISPSLSFNWPSGSATGQSRLTFTGVLIKQ